MEGSVIAIGRVEIGWGKKNIPISTKHYNVSFEYLVGELTFFGIII